MTQSWDDRTIAAITELVACLRPGWDKPGIAHAVHRAYAKRRDWPLVAHLAIEAAGDQTARTPAVIVSRDKPRWTEPGPEPITAGRLCRRCGNVHVDLLDDKCPLPPATVEQASSHASHVRRQLRAGRR